MALPAEFARRCNRLNGLLAFANVVEDFGLCLRSLIRAGLPMFHSAYRPQRGAPHQEGLVSATASSWESPS